MTISMVVQALLDVYLTSFPEEKEAVRKAATKPGNDEMKQHKNWLKRINELMLCGVAAGLLMTAKLIHSQLGQEAPCPFLGQTAFDTGS